VIRGQWSERMHDQRLEAEGVALWCTDRSSGVSDDHRVFVLHVVKL